MTLYDAKTLAHEYAEREYKIIPLKGKKPISTDWPNTPVPSEAEILHLIEAGNIGLLTGGDIVVLDVDPKNDGLQSLEGLKVEGLVLDGVPFQRTGGGGFHYFFSTGGQRINNSVGKLGDGLDIRGEGGQVVIAPSIHPETQKKYCWGIFPNGKLPPFPGLLLDKLKEGSPRVSWRPTKDIRKGERNDHLFRQACAMRARGLGQEAIEAALTEENRRCEVPLSEDEIHRIANSAMRYDAQQDSDTFTDSGNARRLAARHGNDLRFTQSHGWLPWTGQRWEPDTRGHVRQLGKSLARELLAAGPEIENQDRREKFIKNALSLENRGRLDAMIELAKSEPPIAEGAEAFDRDPWLFNAANGTLDLKTGKLRPHDRRDLITKLSPVEYQPGAKAPRFEKFLNEIFADDAELIGYMQRLVGYTLTGEILEHSFHIFYGLGANGKSTLVNIIKKLLGEYATACPADSLLAKRSAGGVPNDVARLAGARFVHASESDASATLAENLVKSLTGGDAVAARFLHKEYFEFTPQFKLVLSTNHRPVVKGTDNAIWRRIKLIPFSRQFARDEQDPGLLEKLTEELPGIFNWAVAGCLQWGQRGLDEPKAVRVAVKKYKSDSDLLGEFVSETIVEKPGGKIRRGLLYNRYKHWAEQAGHNTMSALTFKRQLEERGYTPGGPANSRGFWRDVDVVE